jgi:hypothetical protein
VSPAASPTRAADGGLKPGTPGPIVPVSARELSILVRRAVGGGRRRAVWTHLGNEAAVRLDGARASVADSIVLVGLTLATLETGPQELTTVFAVGSRAKPAGLLAATFAEPVIATSWQALLTVVRDVAASAHLDRGRRRQRRQHPGGREARAPRSRRRDPTAVTAGGALPRVPRSAPSWARVHGAGPVVAPSVGA